MIYLRQGMSGAQVVALQIILNRQLPRGAAPLKVDGIFGPKTEAAVLKFQHARHLQRDGVVAQETWPALTGKTLLSLNAVDVFDPALLSDVDDIRDAGGNPILIGGMCNGLAQVIAEIRMRSRPRSVVLLRFDGHGNVARMNVSRGKGVIEYPEGRKAYPDAYKERDAITPFTLRKMRSTYASLAHIFAPFGSVMMMGCNVAQGAEGRSFVQDLANIWGVPVTAGQIEQKFTFQIRGPAYTAYPRGGDLRSWASRQPEAIAGMSMAM